MRNLTTAVAAVVVAGVAAGTLLFAPRDAAKTAAPAAPAVQSAATSPAPAGDTKAATDGKPAAAKAMTAKECAAICTAKMNAMGMEGSCPESMCKPGVCPMMSGSHAEEGTAEGAPTKP